MPKTRREPKLWNKPKSTRASGLRVRMRTLSVEWSRMSSSERRTTKCACAASSRCRSGSAPAPAAVVVAKPAPPPPPTPPPAVAAPEPTPDALHALQTSYQETLDKLVRELDQTAHFVSYAPPVFVNFHKGIYLQLSIATTIQAAEPASRYRAAALAFDEHIADLMWPVLACFKDAPQFAGIDFSTTVKPAGQAAEYIFDMANQSEEHT